MMSLRAVLGCFRVFCDSEGGRGAVREVSFV